MANKELFCPICKNVKMSKLERSEIEGISKSADAVWMPFAYDESFIYYGCPECLFMAFDSKYIFKDTQEPKELSTPDGMNVISKLIVVGNNAE